MTDVIMTIKAFLDIETNQIVFLNVLFFTGRLLNCWKKNMDFKQFYFSYTLIRTLNRNKNNMELIPKMVSAILILPIFFAIEIISSKKL